ncbi:Formiminotetrahydrofolate cyclodeaminase [Marinilactibacillus piezotolerans]|uniref:Formiminotetrahydrofolate cyclodeaminase n=1 Tax=Marinilactibacillus piezotolerans TaxID=258723 RepID=A0A1I3Z6T3_9LACT|nr:cyclodeaminase/cyclohydrolase family protein [Marinilactibacillus piezotolerans]SFK39743.1 Formiminotetrahydrofolate cyclodeaminase [Marinilactibacillus piezotolerans]
MIEQSISAYLNQLQSKEGMPGGGSATAIIGAMSSALGHMVSDIQKDKKNFKEYKNDLERITKETKEIRTRFEALSEEDAVAFEPVSKAYKLPKETDEQIRNRQEAIESGLKGATQPPLEMMKETLKLIDLYKELRRIDIKGSIVNDIAVGVLFAKTTLQSAYLNVLVNTDFIKNEQIKIELEGLGNAYLVQGETKADQIYADTKYYLVHKKWPALD